ncbi:drug/metabolite transporter (DMT)-like permease [Rheinheimera pacifica]|uniref:DMT family transporter n=1 Tax=Rheinheimera pacifica TaxID=173990 RepID=UPI002167B298|nr:DMT family transporter [Rheinheimera pacifica]MCS4306798.1 drug/metabolite transporter (DMT)-like permease [Rheinheimera pacifica]
MPYTRVVLLTLLALVAFAGNSLLCRAALAHTQIDAASFTSIRLISGAVALWALVTLRRGEHSGRGNWLSALALFVYAAGFSFAYIQLNTGIGALILFGAVQTSMIAYGLWRGERFSLLQWLGLLLACSGLIGLLLPGLSAPPLSGALLMLAAGVAWGVYSLRGKGAGDPLAVTSGNFIRAVPMALLLSVLLVKQASLDSAGVWYALLSGVLTSGIGYAIWYTALPLLKATTAATVQLSVPVLAALGGVLLLQEPLTLRLLLASLAILGGIALVVLAANRTRLLR